MKTTTHLSQIADLARQRRFFLKVIATGAAVVNVPTLLTSCTST